MNYALCKEHADYPICDDLICFCGLHFQVLSDDETTTSTTWDRPTHTGHTTPTKGKWIPEIQIRTRVHYAGLNAVLSKPESVAQQVFPPAS